MPLSPNGAQGRLTCRRVISGPRVVIGGYRWRLMAPEMNEVLWRQSLEMHVRAARIHEDAAERFMRRQDFAGATRAAEFSCG